MTEELARGSAEMTGTDVETSENVGFTGGRPSQNLLRHAGNLIDRPGPGETVDLSAELGQTQVLNFDPSEAVLFGNFSIRKRLFGNSNHIFCSFFESSFNFHGSVSNGPAHLHCQLHR